MTSYLARARPCFIWGKTSYIPLTRSCFQPWASGQIQNSLLREDILYGQSQTIPHLRQDILHPTDRVSFQSCTSDQIHLSKEDILFGQNQTIPHLRQDILYPIDKVSFQPCTSGVLHNMRQLINLFVRAKIPIHPRWRRHLIINGDYKEDLLDTLQAR